MSSVTRKPVLCFSTRSNTNQAVQPQAMARGFKLRIREVEIDRLYYQCSKNKGTDKLRSYHATDLGLCFHICKKQIFSKCGSYNELYKMPKLVVEANHQHYNLNLDINPLALGKCLCKSLLLSSIVYIIKTRGPMVL